MSSFGWLAVSFAGGAVIADLLWRRRRRWRIGCPECEGHGGAHIGAGRWISCWRCEGAGTVLEP